MVEDVPQCKHCPFLDEVMNLYRELVLENAELRELVLSVPSDEVQCWHNKNAKKFWEHIEKKNGGGKCQKRKTPSGA